MMPRKAPSNPNDRSPSYQPLPKNSRILREAKEYLRDYEFSALGLVKQLKHDGFPQSQAQAAVAMCGADWQYQAYRAAKTYLESESFSKKGLIKQLEYDDFTHEEASAGVNRCNVDWQKYALQSAKTYLKDGYPKKHLGEQLQYEGFTDEEIEYVLKRI